MPVIQKYEFESACLHSGFSFTNNKPQASYQKLRMDPPEIRGTASGSESPASHPNHAQQTPGAVQLVKQQMLGSTE